MPSALSIQQLERRLFELGCPPQKLRRKVRELADHHEDLKHAALEEGLSESDAEARADEQLGEPAGLAEQIVCVLRRSSWWGRHPIIGFCLLPLLALLPATGLCLMVLCGAFWLANFIQTPHVSFEAMGNALN